MDKIRADVYFNDNYDIDAVDEICENFVEAQQWYDDGRVRFHGTPERFQEFVRAVRTVATVRKTFVY